jgi:hypothetical protein
LSSTQVVKIANHVWRESYKENHLQGVGKGSGYTTGNAASTESSLLCREPDPKLSAQRRFAESKGFSSRHRKNPRYRKNPRGPSSWPGVPQLPPGSGWGSWPQHQPPQ